MSLIPTFTGTVGAAFGHRVIENYCRMIDHNLEQQKHTLDLLRELKEVMQRVSQEKEYKTYFEMVDYYIYLYEGGK